MYVKIGLNAKYNGKTKEKLDLPINDVNKAEHDKISVYNLSEIQNEEMISINENSSDNLIDVNYIKILKIEVKKLENEKEILDKEIYELRNKIKIKNSDDFTKKIKSLEKERDEIKNSANNYLNLCSQLAEEVIVLRSQLDKISHYKK